MSINLQNLESVVETKMQSVSTPAQAQTLAKVLKQVQSGSIYNVATYSDLPTASAANSGQLYFVVDEEIFYYSMITLLVQSWVSLAASGINALYRTGDQGYMSSCVQTTGSLPGADLRYPANFIPVAWSAKNVCKVVHWGQYGGAGITTDNHLHVWGDSAYGKLGCTCFNDPCRACSPCLFTDAAGGYYYSVVIRDNGTMWGSGTHNMGQLGVGPVGLSATSLTQEFCSATNWTQVEAAEDYRSTGARKTDGTLWFFGCNDNGKFGTSNGSNTTSPVQEFCSATNWSDFNVGIKHVNAVKTDGTLWGAGCLYYTGACLTTIVSSMVQEQGAATNWCSVSGTRCTTLGLKTDGTLWTWGAGSYGSLALNSSTTASCSPVQEITSSTNWCTASMAVYLGAGIKTDGSLWQWGYANKGGIADGDYCNSSTTAYSSPVQEISCGTWICVNTMGCCRTAAITGITL